VLDRLTPQEFEIASLAASGFTNKQIAERLYLSHRTVGGHLHRAFPKLGVSTRAALRDALDALPPGQRPPGSRAPLAAASPGHYPPRIGSSDARAPGVAGQRIGLLAVLHEGRFTMKIVVIGGTGLIGSKVVARLNEHGHEAIPASPRLGINTITRERPPAAPRGASVVVYVPHSPNFADGTAT